MACADSATSDCRTSGCRPRRHPQGPGGIRDGGANAENLTDPSGQYASGHACTGRRLAGARAR